MAVEISFELELIAFCAIKALLFVFRLSISIPWVSIFLIFVKAFDFSVETLIKPNSKLEFARGSKKRKSKLKYK